MLAEPEPGVMMILPSGNQHGRLENPLKMKVLIRTSLIFHGPFSVAMFDYRIVDRIQCDLL